MTSLRGDYIGAGDAIVTANWLGQTATRPVHVEYVTVAQFAGATGASTGSQLTLAASGGQATLGNATFRLELTWDGPPAQTYLVMGPRAMEQPTAGLLVLVPPEESFVIPFPAAAAQPLGSGSILHIPTPIPNIPALAGQMVFLQAARMVPGALLTESGGLRLMIVP